ncbi:siaz-interacting nuclear protein isoform X2 [Triplophysa rosa]|uniref:siaz-interacting nuclear protein isoform X2 n=1 Tax=Triplophysa rosa TaxID=992332 RepID=UPI002545FF4B|nr:siaz-interacting nuclear protein isoform X2 [Triplophysa rosa]
MAHNATETEVAQTNSGQKTTISAFRRREPLCFSPKRRYAVAVISPMQKNDSNEPGFVDDRTLETSPAHSSIRSEETTFGRYRGENGHVRTRQRRATRCKPFSFDEFDAARRVQREMRLQEMRQMQDQWCVTFKAHPVRRYKPLVQPPTHFPSSEQSK